MTDDASINEEIEDLLDNYDKYYKKPSNKKIDIFEDEGNEIKISSIDTMFEKIKISI